MGFILAAQFAAPLVGRENGAIVLGIELLAGIGGALLAVFVQKVAISVAGALAGGFYLWRLSEAASMHDSQWIAALAGAVLGAILLMFLFQWALILLSSVLGADLLLRPIDLSPGLIGALFVILVVVGIAIQARQEFAKR